LVKLTFTVDLIKKKESVPFPRTNWQASLLVPHFGGLASPLFRRSGTDSFTINNMVNRL